MSILEESTAKLSNLKLRQQSQDMENNNHIDSSDIQKVNSKSDYNLFDSRVYRAIKPENFKFTYE